MKQFYTDWEDFQNNKLCNAWVATAIVGSAVIGGLSTAYASSKASSAQQDATAKAAAIAKQQYDTTRSDLSSYREAGAGATTELQSRLPFLTSPIVMDQEALEKTPGYQFARTQGLKAVQNSAASRGLGVSGAAQKGAATFATGLANETYKDQFNLENTNRTNAYSRLKGLVDVGENAAAGTGILGAKSADTQAGAAIGGGNAAAAGYNAIGSSIGNVANNLGGYAMYKGLYGGGNPSSGTDYSGVTPAQSAFWNSGNTGPV